MNAVRALGRTTTALSVLVLVAALGGCGAETRGRWLRVLFDDPPAEAARLPAGEPGSARRDSLAASPSQARPAVEPEAPPAVRTLVFQHGPYASGDCRECHDPDGSRPFQDHAAADPGTGVRLTDDPKRLCLRCHGEFDPQVLAQRAAVVHAPVAAGECLYCHHPHQSRTASLLRAQNAEALCAECHDPADAAGLAGHAEAAAGACLDCHDPHAAARAGLIREGRP